MLPSWRKTKLTGGNSNYCFLEGDRFIRFIPDQATGIDAKSKHRVVFKAIHHFMMEMQRNNQTAIGSF